MTEKVKLTQDQADAIEYVRGNGIEKNVRLHLDGHWDDERKVLDSLSLSDFIDTLYIGYEIEPEFKAGEWVHYDNGKNAEPRYVTSLIRDADEFYVRFTDGRSMPVNEIRHATPEEIAIEKQRRWWKKQGRDVWELKQDDLLYDTKNDDYFEVTHVNSGNIQAYSMEQQKMEYFTQDELEGRFIITCFAKDRKDLKS